VILSSGRLLRSTTTWARDSVHVHEGLAVTPPPSPAAQVDAHILRGVMSVHMQVALDRER
jgi:hypothetical protein